MASIYDANTNYTVNGTDLRSNPGMVTREYLIDVYPTLVDNFRFAGLWGYGNNQWGQVLTGNDTIANNITGISTWEYVSAGYQHCAAIKYDNTLWLWGRYQYGQLGDNNVSSVVGRFSPVQTVSGGTNWKQVSCGYYHTAAIKTDGSLWTWGYNGFGQLGDNTTTNRSSPVQTIAGGTNWKQVSCESDGHTAAIKTDGTLWLWGLNGNGQLGDNTSGGTSTSPIQTVSGGTNWKQVSCARYHTAAIKTDGSLWTWGYNLYGQLGTNDIVHRSSPVQTVSGGTNWKQVSCGEGHTAAIKTDGTLWIWGQNNGGAIGDGTLIHRSSPVQTVSGGTNWKQVSASGLSRSGAIKTDGTLWIWGVKASGGSETAPVKYSVKTNNKFVSNGGEYVVFIVDDSSDPFRAEPL